jgi:anti-sigma B factor antagonist
MGADDFTVEVKGLAETVWVTVEGELDVETAPALERELDRLDVEAYDVRLDLSGVGFVDSMGLAVLLRAARRAAAAGRKLTLAGAAEPVTRLLRLLEIGGLFTLENPSARAASPSRA